MLIDEVLIPSAGGTTRLPLGPGLTVVSDLASVSRRHVALAIARALAGTGATGLRVSISDGRTGTISRAGARLHDGTPIEPFVPRLAPTHDDLERLIVVGPCDIGLPPDRLDPSARAELRAARAARDAARAAVLTAADRRRHRTELAEELATITPSSPRSSAGRTGRSPDARLGRAVQARAREIDQLTLSRRAAGERLARADAALAALAGRTDLGSTPSAPLDDEGTGAFAAEVAVARLTAARDLAAARVESARDRPHSTEARSGWAELRRARASCADAAAVLRRATADLREIRDREAALLADTGAALDDLTREIGVEVLDGEDASQAMRRVSTTSLIESVGPLRRAAPEGALPANRAEEAVRAQRRELLTTWIHELDQHDRTDSGEPNECGDGAARGDGGELAAREHLESAVRHLHDLELRLGEGPAVNPRDVGRQILDRLARFSVRGEHRTILPCVLDDPFTRLDVDDQWDLLDMLARVGDRAQTLLLTDDDVVAAWARAASERGTAAWTVGLPTAVS